MNRDVKRFVILGEGTSDSMLEYPLRWLLSHHGFLGKYEFDNSKVLSLESNSLKMESKVQALLGCTQPDVLFIHRDGDAAGYEARKAEIVHACSSENSVKCIPVIPVKMLESWFLSDLNAIRIAAGNPQGHVEIPLPKFNQLERIANPKEKLFDCLRAAADLKGRRLKKFKPHKARRLVAEEIESFHPLLDLPSFNELSQEIQQLVNDLK
jgi:hypothetical protein